MKKLIIAACAVACAVAAQAATVEWKSGTLYDADATTGAFTSTKAGAATSKAGGATGQLYYIGLSEYTYWAETLAAETTLAGQQAKMLTLIDGLQGGTIGTGAVDKGTGTVVKNAISITDPKSYTGMTKEDPITAYAAVIYTYNDGKTDWAIADVGKVFMEADVKSSAASLGQYFNGDAKGTAIKGWAAVPEPTSGLLLLLGVAGLALRRRRA